MYRLAFFPFFFFFFFFGGGGGAGAVVSVGDYGPRGP